MKSSVVWLRISFWIGAIVDAKVALVLAFPKLMPWLFRAVFGGDWVGEPNAVQSICWLTVILIIAWTSLLVWADRKPLERKGVLLLTIFPIGIGIMMVRFYAIVTGNGANAAYISFTLLMFSLLILFGFSYFINRDRTKSGQRVIVHNGKA